MMIKKLMKFRWIRAFGISPNFYLIFVFNIFFYTPIYALDNNTDFISKTKIDLIYDISSDLKESINNFLKNYIGKRANEENADKASAFLNSLPIIKDAKCNIINSDTLNCQITSKSTVNKIQINHLPASLLQNELKKKLPISMGALIELNDLLENEIKERVNNFLTRNGFYESLVEIKFLNIKKTSKIDVIIDIKGGRFVLVNKVYVKNNNLPIKNNEIISKYEKMCLSFENLITAFSLGTFRCYSRQFEEETTKNLEEKIAQMGYVENHIRVSHKWVSASDKNSPKDCQNNKAEKSASKCIDLTIDVNSGPKVSSRFVFINSPHEKSNGFLKILSKIFLVDNFSRLGQSPGDLNPATDQLIIDDELEDELTFIGEKSFDENEINNSKIALKNYLNTKGYPNAKVSSNIIKQNEQDIEIQFEIEANSRSYIEKIDIFPENYLYYVDLSEIEKIIPNRSWLNSGMISTELIDEAKENIYNQLKNKGFLDIEIWPFALKKESGQVYLTFNITTQRRSLLSKVFINGGNEKLNEKILMSLKNCDNYKPNNFCHNSSLLKDEIESDNNKIEDHYRSEGYLYAKVYNELKESEKGYELFFNIYDERYGENKLSKNKLYKQNIKDIIISGNDTINENVLKRLFHKKNKKDYYTPNTLRNGIFNLKESGRFSSINNKILAVSHNSDDAYFILHLVERPSLFLNVGVSFSTDQFFQLETQIEEHNLFRSMLRLDDGLALGFLFGRQSYYYNKILWPKIFGSPFKLNIEAPSFLYKDQISTPKPRRLFQSRSGLRLEMDNIKGLRPYIGYYLTNKQEMLFPYGTYKTFRENLNSLDGFLDVIKTKGNLRGSLIPGIDIVMLDDPFNPKKGFKTETFMELSGGIFYGDPAFLALVLNNSFYKPLGPLTLALAVNFARGFVDPIEENWQVISSEKTIDLLGGDLSIRGYSEREIGMTSLKTANFKEGAGYLLNNTKFEVRFPLNTHKNSNFTGAFFMDEGFLIPCADLFDCFSKEVTDNFILKKALGLSIGPALRYNLPVGLISLEYGFSPLHLKGRFHLLFGYSF